MSNRLGIGSYCERVSTTFCSPRYERDIGSAECTGKTPILAHPYTALTRAQGVSVYREGVSIQL